MSKRQYLSALLTMPIDWLRASAENPSAYMSTLHIKLHLIAIRKLGGI